MFREIYGFELRYWLRQPLIYVFMFLNALLVFGAVSSDHVAIGQTFDNLNKNAPYVVESMYAYMSGVMFLIATAFVQASALRDFNHRSQEIVFTTPLARTPYLLGRFFGACTVALVPYLGVTLGVLAGGVAPWVDPQRVGPVDWVAHVNGLLAFAVPNTLIVGGLIFALAAMTRRTAATFVGAMGVLVAYSVGATLLGELDNERLGALVDAFGVGTFANLTKYWTVADRNAGSLPLSGLLLLNRVVWLSVSAGAVAVGLRIFRFTIDVRRFPSLSFRKKTAVPAGTPAGPGEDAPLTIRKPLPPARLSFTAATRVRQMLSQARVDLLGIVKSVPFGVILLFGMANVGTALWQANEFYGLTAYPVTYRMVGLIRGSMYLFTLVVLVLYTGELVWKERSVRVDEIHDALPHPVWVTALGKLLAILGVLVVLQLVGMAMGMIGQVARGYTNFEPGVYVKELLVLDLASMAFLAVLSLLIHVVANNKFLGYFAFIAVVVLNTLVWGPLKIQTLMVRYGGAPSYTYSDMNGFGPYVSGLLWFNVYWVFFAGLLVVAAILMWVRGTDADRKTRRRNVRLRFRGSVRAAALGLAVGWIAMAGFVYRNTQVVNGYTPTRTLEDRAQEYEERYKAAYQGMPLPRVVDVTYDIDVYPHRRGLDARGDVVLVNESDVPIDTLFVNLDRDMSMDMEIPGATVAREDAELGVRFYHLSPALQPGDSVPAHFTASYESQGFENQVSVTQVVPNGTFFNNGMISPSLGYQTGRELPDRNERRKRGLPERDRMPALQRDCTDACRNTYINNASDWVTMRTTISTSEDQIAVAPGSLVRDWTEDGRHYFEYVLDHPSLAFTSFISADYQVRREKWGDVDVEVYYDAHHPYNVDKMVNAIRKSLDYYQASFGPYRHKQARIIEFPRYASFAQSFPGTMPYSEGIGFIARIEKPDDIDMVFYVTAHEMAHQWWAHQVIGANMEGATVLSETLAQYSALMTMEREFGKDHIHRFLKYEMDQYLRSRGTEQLKEKPLMRVDASQGYVHYRKGSVVMYYLKEMIGEDHVNAALRDLVDTYGYAGPPYPTSWALVDRLRAQTPDSLSYLITDLFETITLFDNRVVGDPTYAPTGDGRWRVTFDVSTAKFRADSLGAETAVPMDDYVDVGVFGRPTDGEERGPTLGVERRRLEGGQHTIEMVVDEEPWQVGIDPSYYLIDRVPSDNLKRVKGT